MPGWKWRNPLNTQFRLNRNSPQARGLVAWWPLFAKLENLADYPSPRATLSNTSYISTSEYGRVPRTTGAIDSYINLGTTSTLQNIVLAPFTVTVRFRFSSTPPTIWSKILAKGDQSFGVEAVAWGGDQTGFTVYTDTWVSTAGISTSVGVWHLGVGIYDGSNIRYGLDNIYTGNTAASGIATSSADLWVGNNVENTSQSASVDIAETRLYNYALSPQEIWQLYAPQTRWELYEPIIPKWSIGFVAAGGPTTYNQSVSGALAPTGILLNQGQKALGGTVTPTAGLILQTQKVLSGSLTPTGALLNQGQKALTGAITPVGGLINQIQKVLLGGVTPAGVLLNQGQKILSGGLAPIGGSTNQAQKVLSGVIAPIGELIKETQKILDGGITPNGILTGSKTALLNLIGSLAPSGILSKETQKALNGSLTPVGSILKQVGKLLTGALTPIGVLTASLVSTNLESTFKGMFRGIFRRMK